MFQFL